MKKKRSISASSVSAAFELLVEEIEADIAEITQHGLRASERGDQKCAASCLERLGKITALREKLAVLRSDWAAVDEWFDEVDTESKSNRRDLGRLRRGERTPERRYYVPILRALEKLGGSASSGNVLESVLELMQHDLKKADFQPLASDPALPRWRNSASWARHSMCREGLLKTESPRGIWEISEAGKRYLSNFDSRGRNGNQQGHQGRLF